MKKISVIVVAALIALCVSGLWLRRARALHEIVVAFVPREPDLSAASPALRARIAEATAQIGHRSDEIEALAELSRLYHANGFLTEAVRCYEGLEQLEPTNPRWPHLRATILAGYGDTEPALVLWQRVVKLNPRHTIAQLRMADIFLKTNRQAEAATLYEDVLKRDPNEHYAILGLARIDAEAGRWEKARDRLEDVVNNTRYQLGYDLIVTVYEHLGQADRAAKIRGKWKASGAYRDLPDPSVDQLQEDCFDPYRLSLAAGVADRNGQFDTAVRLLQRASQYAPNDVSAPFQLGGLYDQHGDLKSAAQLFTQCTTLAPDFADGWIHLSDVYTRQGDPTAAGRVVLTGLDRCPDSPGLRLARARQLRAGKQIDAAIDEFKTSIRLRPNEPEAYLDLGAMLIENDRVAEGVEQLKKALDAEPENPTALGILAFHAISTGHEPEARQWLARVKQQPRVPSEQAEQLFAAFRQTFGREFN